ncbi:MAG: YitT family protein [Clostridiales bacterium]|nr:YitT family protein [Clostridiales bacterium]
MTTKTKKRLNNFLVVPLVILLSGLLRAVIVNMFVMPFEFATSGVTGIGVLIEHAVPWFSAGYTTLILNFPLLVLAFIYIGKKFTLISGIAIVFSAIGMIVMKQFDVPTYAGGEPIFAALIAGVLSGVGFVMMIRIGGSTGGSDIIAMLIHKKYSATNISWYVYGVDALIIFASIFVFNRGGHSTVASVMTPVFMALTEEFSHAMIGDVILTGFKTALKYEIITDEPEELSSEIMTKLGRGVTCTEVTGMYSHDKRSLLVCVIRKRQLSEFNKILKKYPNAFAYLISTREVIGKGFSN